MEKVPLLRTACQYDRATHLTTYTLIDHHHRFRSPPFLQLRFHIPTITSPHSFKMATIQGNGTPQSVYPKSHVGFDSITSQIERKLLKRGFQFNVICVGTITSQYTAISYEGAYRTRSLIESTSRTNWSRKVHSHQHYFRFSPHRLERTSGPR